MIRPTLFFFLFPVALVAQPVLEHPSAIPAFGPYSIEARSYGVVPGIATSGTNVIWDLSSTSFSVIGTTADSVLLPIATPYASDYPGATHAVRLVDQFGYYRVSADHVEDLGYRPSAASPSFIYSDPARILQFPSEVGDSWTDVAVSGTSTTLTVTVLAEGELRLTDTTIPDAVLIRREYAGSSSTATSTTWFRRSDALRPLGNLLANGGVIVRVPQEANTSVNEDHGRAVNVSPNPFHDNLRIVLNNEASAAILVIDATGRVVATRTSVGPTMLLDLTEMASGPYTLRIMQRDGQKVLRVMKQ